MKKIIILICFVMNFTSCSTDYESACFAEYEESEFGTFEDISTDEFFKKDGVKKKNIINSIIKFKPRNLKQGIRIYLTEKQINNNLGLSNFKGIYNIQDSIAELCYFREWINYIQPHLYEPESKGLNMQSKDYFKNKVTYFSNETKGFCHRFFTKPAPYKYKKNGQLSEITFRLSRVSSESKDTMAVANMNSSEIYGLYEGANNVGRAAISNNFQNIVLTDNIHYIFDDFGLIKGENGTINSSTGTTELEIKYYLETFYTSSGMMKIIIKLKSESPELPVFDLATIYFDEKSNWIKMEFQDRMEQRRINYKTSS